MFISIRADQGVGSDSQCFGETQAILKKPNVSSILLTLALLATKYIAALAVPIIMTKEMKVM